ncbi:MAG: bifunctional oligoribonuclease/PAP phosphatase NrnA [Candidatus Omnitrophota bacterium]
MNDEMIEQVIEVLKTKDNFMVTGHINPEGDSIGSQLSIFCILKKLGKKAVMAGNYTVPENLKFLPGTEYILSDISGDFQPEIAIVLDCPTKGRVGNLAGRLDDVQLIVNIDHHVSNEYFGEINWVEAESSSVGEMIFAIVEKMGIDLDHDISSALYAAIVTDTGMFNYDNTSARTHEVAGKLIASGISPKAMHGRIFEDKDLSQIRVLGRVLTTIEVEESGRLAHMCLTRDMCEKEGVRDVATDEFINYPRSIKGVEVAVFFKERVNNPGAIDVSFRSSEEVDVDVIASRFGGGGHKRAAGCVVRGGIEKARENVLREVRKEL